MKNFMIILLSVVILALTGCGKADNNKSKDAASDNLAENTGIETESTADYTTEKKESQKTEESKKENEGSETIIADNTQTSKEASEEPRTVTPEQNTQIPPQAVETTPQEGHKTEQPVQPEEQPVKQPESVETDVKYDIESLEYQNELKRLTIYYINQYREEEGHVALSEDTEASEFAQARSVQLLKNFAHDVSETRALATEMKYGTYVDTKLYGMNGDPYYTPYGQEAIAKIFGNQGSSADDVAKRIASGFYRSKLHWNYIGGTMRVYEPLTNCGIGVSYKGGYWHCSMYVLEPR